MAKIVYRLYSMGLRDPEISSSRSVERCSQGIQSTNTGSPIRCPGNAGSVTTPPEAQRCDD